MSSIFTKGKQLLSLMNSQKRFISFYKGTEGLKDTTDPTIMKNIFEIDAQDKLDKKETHVFKGGIFSQYNVEKRHVYLPLGDKDLVAASHELQHARDFVKIKDVLPSQNVLEMRAFKAQSFTAKYLGLSDQLKGMTPEQRAETHSQVKKKD